MKLWIGNRFLIVALAGMLSVTVVWAQSGTLDRIRTAGAINLGYVEGAAPFSFIDAARQPQGYSVDLCRRIANGIREQLGMPALDMKWVALSLQNRLEAVRGGKVDIECSTTTWTLSRQKDVDFSLITFVDGASLLVRAPDDITRVAQLGGKRIAVITGTTTEKVLRDTLGKRGIAAEVVTVRTRDEGFQLLAKGNVDGFASDRVVLIGMVSASKGAGEYKLLDEDFSVEPYALALPRGDHEFRLAVNRVLAGLFRSGEIDKVYGQWLGPLGRPSLLLSAAYYIQGLAE